MSTVPTAHVRLFKREDRSAVRKIAWETGDAGNPTGAFFNDPEFFADIITRHYTDDIPSWSWVAEADGTVVGYLTGCPDTSTAQRAIAYRILPCAVFHSLITRRLFNPLMRQFLRLNIPLWLSPDGRRHLPLADYPAHLHINLCRSARGLGLGPLLIRAFIDALHERRIPGVHASVREDNLPAAAFFEKQWFHFLSRQPFMRIAGAPPRVLYSSLFGMKVG